MSLVSVIVLSSHSCAVAFIVFQLHGCGLFWYSKWSECTSSCCIWVSGKDVWVLVLQGSLNVPSVGSDGVGYVVAREARGRFVVVGV